MYLNCHSYFSLKYGTIDHEQLLEMMQKENVSQFALTDINNTSAILHILRLAKNSNTKVVPGIDFRNGVQQQFIGLAQNNEGFYALNHYLSTTKLNNQPFPKTAPEFSNAYVIYPYGKKEYHQLKQNEYVGIGIHQINKLLFTSWKEHTDKLVILHAITFKKKSEFNAHRLLRAIDNNTLLSQLHKSELANPNEVFIPENELEQIFSQYPQIIKNTKEILLNCTVDFDFNHEQEHNNLKSYTGNEALDFKLLKKLCWDGLSYRYDNPSENILSRIDKELQTIQEKGFVTYFLVAWKIIKYAREQGYFYVGRGSGANSIISYLLRITDVDPIELDLYFERFINLFRKNPPDFDIDFSWKEREDVTRYIFTRFKHVALLGAYSTFKYKSIVRELAKIFGLPEHEIKKLQSDPQQADSIGKLVLQYSRFLQGFPSHITVHSSGIVIANQSLHHFATTFMPPKGYPTTHFDMHTAEDVGLYKFDILGQRGLAKVKDTLQLIKQQHDVELDIHNMKKLKLDIPSNDLLKKGEAIGCFYVESPAMRMLLMKLKVDDYLGLVAASSVIRPGVAQSGMMREYILRHRDPNRRKWAEQTFPVLYKLMPETYGVMVYQEDVIKVAHYFAGLTLAEADVLRRGMSGKFRSRAEFQEVKQKFFDNCKTKGISDAYTLDVWQQIESFAGYAFAKGHSASYAVESYQCLYLKAYYPLEFLVATINNGGGFYSRELYLHEARKHGAAIELPCINQSHSISILIDNQIYIGLSMIHELQQKTMRAILIERYQNGIFEGLTDIVHRLVISLEQIIILIRSGALRFTGMNKKELLWQAHFLMNKEKKTKPIASLFKPQLQKFELPPLWFHELENIYDEMELIGFTVTESPFKLVKDLPHYKMNATLLPFHIEKKITLVGYLIHIKNTATKHSESMHFGTFIDMQGNWIDTVIFPQVAQRYPFTGPGCYILHGKVVEEFGHVSLEIIWQKRLVNQSLDDDVASTKLKRVSLTG